MRLRVTGLFFLTLAAGCRKPAPATPPPEETKLAPVEVKKDGSALYTYVDSKGDFVTVDKPDAVPPDAAPEVQVLLTEAAAGKNLQELVELSREGTLVVARRLLELYRLGALVPLREVPIPVSPGGAGAELQQVQELLDAVVERRLDPASAAAAVLERAT